MFHVFRSFRFGQKLKGHTNIMFGLLWFIKVIAWTLFRAPCGLGEETASIIGWTSAIFEESSPVFGWTFPVDGVKLKKKDLKNIPPEFEVPGFPNYRWHSDTDSDKWRKKKKC